MKLTRREFLRGAVGWGGLMLAGSIELLAARSTEPMRRALRCLAARQSADGAWRSDRYAAFREGDVLTPVALWAMQAARTSNNDAVFARGMAWLRQLSEATTARQEPWTALRYPLFTASYAAQVLAREGDTSRAEVWGKIIEQLRTSSALGWPVGDPMTGAWSDAASPPHFTLPVPDMLAPNISATALAGSALVALGASISPAALPFTERCQNFSEGEPTRFDDGGFFFALGDPIRNKAGSAGRDGRGRERFHSYGSATCDGYLALRACGLPHDHPRVQAAIGWLRANCTGMTHGGKWTAGRAEARASLVYYHSQTLAAVLVDLPQTHGWNRSLRASLVSEIEAQQSDEGSWQGLAPDSCEDEPVLATAFALRTLALLA
jgi:squalene-hopene/tetraprenyl-beta-curcumene cyclase